MKLSRLDLKHCECCPLPHRKIFNIVLSSLLVDNVSWSIPDELMSHHQISSLMSRFDH
jgi:hypothetical protein